MDFTEFSAGQNDNDRRLDKILRNFIKDTSLSQIYKSIRKGLIKINKKNCKPEDHVYSGDIISIASFLLGNSVENEKSLTENPMVIKNLPEVVFENNHVLILNKPYNLSVHGDSKSLDKIVVQYYKSKNIDDSLSFTPGPLHRIDKKTTGLVAFSFSLEGAHWFSENIKNHNIKKLYYGLVEGHLASTEYWKDEITNNHEKTDSFYKVSADNEKSAESKTAVTIVTPVQKGYLSKIPVTFVSFNIETGRKHQIRAQCGFHNHPLAGDSVYGGKKSSAMKQDFYLQASKLLIPENPIGLPSVIQIPLSPSFDEILTYCGIKKRDI